MRRNRRRHEIADRKPLRVSLAAIVVGSGQRLRSDETASRSTFALAYAAKWAQATGGAR